jgi:hypothetical protein
MALEVCILFETIETLKYVYVLDYFTRTTFKHVYLQVYIFVESENIFFYQKLSASRLLVHNSIHVML